MSEVVEYILSRPNLTLEAEAFLNWLVKLIKDFESKLEQINVSTFDSRILHLLKM